MKISTQKAELAWPLGDIPGELSFAIQPPVKTRAFIKNALAPFTKGITGDLELHALTPPDGIIGRYCLKSAAGKWFVRVSSRTGFPSLEKELIDYLASKGIPVNQILYTTTAKDWQNHMCRIDVRPLIDGRHYDWSSKDLYHLAKLLRATHCALKNFSRSEEIKAVAAKRYCRLSQITNELANALHSKRFGLFGEMDHWAQKNQAWLEKMIANFQPLLHLLPEAQCLHGEIHPGNVLFSHDSGEAILIDFEESIHVYAPQDWDMAFFLQRFCLRDDPDPRTLEERLQIVKQVYLKPLPELAEMMRQTAWFSIAVILELLINQQTSTAQSEYNKFVILEQQAERLSGW